MEGCRQGGLAFEEGDIETLLLMTKSLGIISNNVISEEVPLEADKK